MVEPTLEAPGIAGASNLRHAARRWPDACVLLVLVILFVTGAWLIGGRQGFDRVGTGGQHLQLLPKIGDPAPDIVAPTVAGQPVRLSDLRGQPVWLTFWGSWCPPCRSEFPEMQVAWEKALKPNGIMLLAISLDEPAEDAAGFALRNDGTFPILTDPTRSFTGAAYPISNFPTHILIDREGIVRDIILSPIDEPEIIRRAQAITMRGDAS